MKTCTRCGLEKPDSEFYQKPKHTCKVCHRAAVAKWAIANPEKIRQYKRTRSAVRRAQYAADPLLREAVRQRTREYQRQRRLQFGKAKINAIQREWRRQNPSKTKAQWRRHRLKRAHGITEADYRAMLASQGGMCAICGGPPKACLGDVFCVDHDHVTGQIRGLLCGNCNKGIGCLADDPDIVTAAAAYLLQHRLHRIA
jgi:hypothetical protein